MPWTCEQNCGKAILYMSIGCWNHYVKFPIQPKLSTHGISICYILQSHVTSTTFTFYKPQVVAACFLWYMFLSLHRNLNECTCFDIVSSFFFKACAFCQWNTTFLFHKHNDNELHHLASICFGVHLSIKSNLWLYCEPIVVPW